MLDVLVVGSGLFGATFANLATRHGLRVQVIDRRKHLGGNCYSENVEGIEVHKYGPHIFHTSDRSTWEYVRKFSDFIPYIHRIKANHKGRLYSFPINLSTVQSFYPDVHTSEEARHLFDSFTRNPDTSNFEEFLIGEIGEELYNAFYYGYTKKQWGREPRELPAFLAKRIPIYFDQNTRYFNDVYEGIPTHGYTRLIQNMLRGVDVRLNVNYFDDKLHFESLAKTTVYTGELDRFFGYRFGKLEYRSLHFEESILLQEQFQDCAIVNFSNEEEPFTRITEHKHFTGVKTPHTVITREYPGSGNENYYPVNDPANNAMYREYSDLSKQLEGIIFGGRLAEYRYFNMDQVIQSATRKFKRYADADFRKFPTLDEALP